MKKVKAAVLVKPGQFEVREFPYPQIKDSHALLKVELCGICGTDKHIYKGETTLYGGTTAEVSVPFPIILGHEIVGIIAEIGSQANKTLWFPPDQRITVGDRVVVCPDIPCGRCFYCQNYGGGGFIWCENIKTYGNNLSCKEPPYLFGGMAEYMVLLPGTFVCKVPETIKPETAVLTELMAVTYNVDKAKEFYNIGGEGFKSGDTVVVQGVGPMGLMHIIKARILGAGDIIAIDSSEFRLGMAKEFGANYTINISKMSPKERIEFVYDLTHGRGADLTIECTGVPQAIIEGLELTRRGGMYIVAGVFVDTGDITLNPHRHICAKNIRLLGQTNHPPRGYLSSLKLFERYASYFPPFERIITHRFVIEDVEQAFAQAMDAHSTMKVVLACSA
ncbi:MAG: alcohol dehydrogenase catalytic domain-containing protein [Methanomassiliicoccales archaeon]|nr:alcohol dehydrogenase catalytic domain-containing protein [Methanomassiliicoccales archaeon]